MSFVTQRPLELILARNLMWALDPAFLVDKGGVLVFYNEAAGSLLGKRFEELGRSGAQEWGGQIGPVDERASRSHERCRSSARCARAGPRTGAD